MPDKRGSIAEGSHIPARVAAIAAHIEDIPDAWNEKEDGSVVIVFSTKGKQTFERTYQVHVQEFAKPIIHTKAEAEEVAQTLPPKAKLKKEK